MDIRRLWRRLRARLQPAGPVPFDVRRPPGPLAPTYAIGLVVTTFDRPEYVRRCFADLAASDLAGAVVAIVDDASGDPETIRLVESFEAPGAPVLRVRKRARRDFAVHESLRLGWDLLLAEFRCPLLANLDSDTIVRPGWLRALADLHAAERPRRGPLVVTGFNAPAHEVLETGDGWCRKSSLGGINMLFDAALYAEVIRPSLVWEPDTQVGWDWYVVGRMRQRGYTILCTRPSVIQHIGASGRFSSPERGYDVAVDF